MKQFSKEKWSQSLAVKGWENIGTTDDVNVMAVRFGIHVENALNECAPWKEMKVRRNYVYGLSEETNRTLIIGLYVLNIFLI